MNRSILSRVFETELWTYESVSTRALLRICQITRWISIPCFWAAGVMAVCFFEIIVLSKFRSEGAPAMSNITLFMLIASGIISGVLMIPSLIGLALFQDIEPVLAKRGVRIPKKRSLNERLNESLIKLILFFALPIMLIAAIERPNLYNWLVVFGLLLIAVAAMMKRPVKRSRPAKAIQRP